MSGVWGALSLDGQDLVEATYLGLRALQSRGEDGTGLALVRSHTSITTWAAESAVDRLMERALFDNLRRMTPNIIIGHTRRRRRVDPEPLQPLNLEFGRYTISIGVNGALVQYEDLIVGGPSLLTEAEIVGTIFGRNLQRSDDLWAAGQETMKTLSGRGSYCATLLVDDGERKGLVALRDPKGIKPLCLGKREQTYFLASETTGLPDDGEFLDFVKPGEMVAVSEDGLERRQLWPEEQAFCVFEYIYYASGGSELEHGNVFDIRRRDGLELAKLYPIEADSVMPIPDSGRGVSVGIAEGLGIPYGEGLERVKGSLRTYMITDPEDRIRAVRSKFKSIPAMLEGKRVAAGEDSIVKGSITRYGAIHKLEEGGVTEVHLMVSCPPYAYTCFRDFRRPERLAAQGLSGKDIHEVNEIVAKRIGADHVCYQTKERLLKVIGSQNLCMACLDGRYPIKKQFLPEGYESSIDQEKLFR